MTNDDEGRARAERERRRAKAIEAAALGIILFGFGFAYLTGDDPRLGISIIVLGALGWGWARWKARRARRGPGSAADA